MFEMKDFSLITYDNGLTFWNYQTNDTLDDLRKPGYFDNAYPIARCGDMIFVTADKAKADDESEIQSAIFSVVKIENYCITVRQLTN